MKTFHYTIKNYDIWAITDNEIIIVAENIDIAFDKLVNYYKKEVFDKELLIELEEGVHIVQFQFSE